MHVLAFRLESATCVGIEGKVGDMLQILSHGGRSSESPAEFVDGKATKAGSFSSKVIVQARARRKVYVQA